MPDLPYLILAAVAVAAAFVAGLNVGWHRAVRWQERRRPGTALIRDSDG
jgi:hypothetical protein